MRVQLKQHICILTAGKTLVKFDDDAVGNRTDSSASCKAKILVIYHVTPIFYCLISYVYCLIASAAKQPSFLHHLTSFACWLLPFVLRSRVYCLPSALFCHILALLWLYQLRSLRTSSSEGRGNPPTATSIFYAKILQQSLPAWWRHSFLVTC